LEAFAAGTENTYSAAITSDSFSVCSDKRASGFEKASKRFFFEKKKQKTFGTCGRWHRPRQGPQ